MSKNKVLIEEPQGKADNKLIAFTGLMNLHYLGYTLSVELFQKLCRHDKKYIELFYKKLIAKIRKNMGGHVDYHPFYPGFPSEVIKKPYFELYYNAYKHYISYGKIVPENVEIEEANAQYGSKNYGGKVPVAVNTRYAVLSEGTDGDAAAAVRDLMASNASLTPQETGWVIWFIGRTGNPQGYIPENIPFKENMAVVYGSLFKYNKTDVKTLKEKLNTSTDILRFITFLSGGDVSLSEKCKFIKFTRKDRRMILELLENCESLEEGMKSYKDRWLRIGEILHPGEYPFYTRVNRVYKLLRNNGQLNSFNSVFERYVSGGDAKGITDILSNRPGEFARRLDYLLRTLSDKDLILKKFAAVADEVSIPVLLQVRNHFEYRNCERTFRSFVPKGVLSKAYAIPYNLVNMGDWERLAVMEICTDAVIKKCRSRSGMGKVYIDESLVNYSVPFALRSASKALKTVGRGSRIDFYADMDNFVRLFLWWKNGKYRTDIDLSAVFLSEKWDFIDRTTYYHLKNQYSVHSGDFIDAPEGASEFIDISINKARKSGVKYVAMVINSYTQQPFCDLPECFAGIMYRKNFDSDDLYDPKTVENKFDISGDTKINIPLVFDLENMQMIWLDMAVTSFKAVNNVDTNKNALIRTCASIVETPCPSIYDLIYLNALGRGVIVDDKQDADISFGVGGDYTVTPYDTDLIRSYL